MACWVENSIATAKSEEIMVGQLQRNRTVLAQADQTTQVQAELSQPDEVGVARRTTVRLTMKALSPFKGSHPFSVRASSALPDIFGLVDRYADEIHAPGGGFARQDSHRWTWQWDHKPSVRESVNI